MVKLSKRTERELERAIVTGGGFIAEVFQLIDDSTVVEIAEKFGHRGTRNVQAHLDAIDFIFDPTMRSQTGAQAQDYARSSVRRMLAGKTSDQLAEHLSLVVDDGRRKSSSPARQIEALRRATPGVYVYTYPQYLIAEVLRDDARTMFKVGSSAKTQDRIEAQSRQTEVPEDIEVVRIYPGAGHQEKEARFHRILKAAGHHHKTTRAGAEWFNTSLEMLDAIAESIGLEVVIP